MLAFLALTLTLGCGQQALRGPVETTGAVSAQGKKKQTGPGWYAVQLHAHSEYSDGNMDVAAMIAEAKRVGLDALALSDHDSTSQWLDPAFVAEKELVMLRSQEGGDTEHGNHVGLHGFKGMTPVARSSDREQVLSEASAREATIVLNHPFNRFLAWKPLVLDPRVHAIEVWNSWYWNPIRTEPTDPEKSWRPNEEAVAWWAENLSRGARVAAIAAADFHRKPQQLGTPCTLIWAEERSQAAILAGVRAGRTTLVTSPRTERVELTADRDGDGRFESMVGDTVPAGAKVRVRVTGGKGMVLKLMRGSEAIVHQRVPGQDWTKEVQLKAEFGKAPFVYARLNGSDLPGTMMRAMTGAVYLR